MFGYCVSMVTAPVIGSMAPAASCADRRHSYAPLGSLFPLAVPAQSADIESPWPLVDQTELPLSRTSSVQLAGRLNVAATVRASFRPSSFGEMCGLVTVT